MPLLTEKIDGTMVLPHRQRVDSALGQSVSASAVHMQEVLRAAREAKLRGTFAMHRRYRAGGNVSWKYIAPIQRAVWKNKSFASGN